MVLHLPGLNGLSVLLVDDSPFMLELLSGVLKGLGVGRIITAENGEEAISLLKRAERSGDDGDGYRIDAVLSDLVMRPVNGMELLEWVRRDAESPNRFMPFVMISGAAHEETIAECRDAGVSEFLAKPFSVDMVSRRLLGALDKPRPFVVAPDYFGPDRRRRDKGASQEGDERRQVAASDHGYLDTDAGHSLSPKGNTDVWLIQLPKLVSLGRRSVDGDLETRQAYERAEAHIDGMAALYRGRMKAMLDAIRQLLEDMGRDRKTGRPLRYINEINGIALEIAGQGATFGFPLITLFGQSLYRYTRGRFPDHVPARVSVTFLKAPEDKQSSLIECHLDAMARVLEDRITGDGGEIGKALLNALDQAILVYAPKEEIAGQRA